jgi:hypothetical protein
MMRAAWEISSRILPAAKVCDDILKVITLSCKKKIAANLSAGGIS